MNKRQDKTDLELYAQAETDAAMLQAMWQSMQEDPRLSFFDGAIQRSILRAQKESTEIKTRYENK